MRTGTKYNPKPNLSCSLIEWFKSTIIIEIDHSSGGVY